MIRKRVFAIAAHLLKAPVINTYQPAGKLFWMRECLCTNSLSKGKQKDSCAKEVVTCTLRQISAAMA